MPLDHRFPHPREDTFLVLRATLDELDVSAAEMEKFRAKYAGLVKRPLEPNTGQPLCATLFRQFGAYSGPGNGHVGEFSPQLARQVMKDVEKFQGAAIRYE
jgi:hypothetical protein